MTGEWHGADISGNMIAYAAERTRGVPNVHLHELPDSSLGIFPDGYFDVVYSTIVFMHLDKIDMFRYIKEAYRVLAPGGRAYFDTYNILGEGAWGEFVNLEKVYTPGRRPQHMSQFSTPQEMERLMQKAGFEGIDVSGENEVLVVGRGRKPAQEGWVRPALAVREYRPESAENKNGTEGEETRAFSMAEVLSLTGANKSLRAEADELAREFHSQAEYVRKLEQALEEKNGYIAELEVRLKESEEIRPAVPRISLSGVTGLLLLAGNVIWAGVLWRRRRNG
jgi:SAM-dependent methyltransferase